jgi:hypothetical protein
MNNSYTTPSRGIKRISINDRKYAKQWSIIGTFVTIISLLSFSMFSGADLHSINVKAAVDIDTSGEGRAAAYDGEEGIATEGDSFCSITNDIAGEKFSSLFEGIVGDCDSNSQSLDQFLVEYSFTKNPVKIGENTYLTITVKDKETGNPISNAYVTLDVEPPTALSVDGSIDGEAVAAAGIPSNQETAVAAAGIPSNQEKINDQATQAMYTDNNGHATFTLQIGPDSEVGNYNTQFEVKKDSYQSSLQQANLNVA